VGKPSCFFRSAGIKIPFPPISPTWLLLPYAASSGRKPPRVERPSATLAALALVNRTKILFIGPKKIAEQIVHVHPDVDVGWFNAIVGRDEWRGTPTTVLAGRNQPPPPAIETMAEALTGWELTRKREVEAACDATTRCIKNGRSMGSEC
jgi:hypothetical protein